MSSGVRRAEWICRASWSLPCPTMSLRLVGPQHLDKCSQRHLGILYQKACSAFQNVSRLEYFEKIRTFLGESRHTEGVATTGILKTP